MKKREATHSKFLKRMKKSRFNLIMLGAISIAIASATTGISLIIYHNSGDIYLDRSRPGFLPDEAEVESEEEKKLEYELDKSGKINSNIIEEYLDNLNAEAKSIDAFEKPFSQDALSNERLGIPKE